SGSRRFPRPSAPAATAHPYRSVPGAMLCQKGQCPELVGPKIETTLGRLAGPTAARLAGQPARRPCARGLLHHGIVAGSLDDATHRTPRTSTTPPPPRHPNDEVPPLLLALEQNCLKQARFALEVDPGAAKLPFLQPRFEWPPCAAIRLGCSGDVVRLLFEHGAEVEVTNTQGQSPLQLLSSGAERHGIQIPRVDLWGTPGLAEWAEWMLGSTEQYELDVATALLIAGAGPATCRGDPARGYCSSLELARRAGKGHLVGLYEAGTTCSRPDAVGDPSRGSACAKPFGPTGPGFP
ncbi:unnamed protein product, partial [Prorocentrum cordatum]